MKFKIFFALFVLLFVQLSAQAQNFPDKLIGVWSGTMEIFARGELKDKVDVRLTVAKTAKAGDYTWKTEYLSKTRPMTKDYVLRVVDAAKGHYVTDEGGGLLLDEYLFGNKLYSVFETGGVYLTATYELRGEDLIFEVTSGKKGETAVGVQRFSVDNLQRVVFRKSK